MSTSGVYLIRNNINGKIYVGSTRNIRTRWNEHRTALNCGKHFNKYLQRAWYKYGPDSFSFSVLEEVAACNLLIEREQHYLDVLKPWQRSRGYNILRNAYSPIGRVVSAETRQRLSEANKGRPLTQAHKDKLARAHTGKKLSAEHKQKISNAGRGRTPSQETRRKLSEARKGKRASPETRLKLSLRPITPDTRQKMSEAFTGREVTEATRKKISAGLKGIKRSAETRKKLAETALKNQARYTQAQVTDMRTLKAQGISYKEIAQKYGCCLATAREIILGHRKNYPLEMSQITTFQNAPNRKKPRFSEADIKEMQRLRKSGLSYPKIATLLGCSKASVQRILSGKWTKYNLDKTDTSGSAMTGRILKFSRADAEQMRRLRSNGMSYAEIAKQFETTGGTVRDIVIGKIKAYPLSANDADFKRQPKTSIEDIQRMKELHDEGMQYKQIAALFSCSDGHVRALLQCKYKRKRVA